MVLDMFLTFKALLDEIDPFSIGKLKWKSLSSCLSRQISIGIEYMNL